METQARAFLSRLSCFFLATGTLTLILIFAQRPPSSYCITRALTTTPFPSSSCDSNRRRLPVQPSKLHSSRAWISLQSSYSDFFRRNVLPSLPLDFSKVLCVSAGAGHQVAALASLGLKNVTGVEIIDSPPFVRRADPHNLPFFDAVFDLAFSANLQDALFPGRYAREMERTVRMGGWCVVLVDPIRSEGEEIEAIRGLFRSSELIRATNVTLLRTEMTQIVMRVRNDSASY